VVAAAALVAMEVCTSEGSGSTNLQQEFFGRKGVEVR